MAPSISPTASFVIPLHYQAVPSAVKGIDVYAPVEVSEETPEFVTYKCPNCGANTRFDISAGGVACEHCGFQTKSKAVKVGLGAAVFEFTLESLNQSEKGWGVDRQEFDCQSCGAVISTEAQAISNTCPFCGSQSVHIHSASGESLRPGYIIPFKIKNDILAQNTRQWLGKGWFHPDQLVRHVGIERFKGIYLPFWTFNTDIRSQWKAEVGYDRQESYYNSSTHSNETRTRTDWRWETGQNQISIENLAVPGTARLSRNILDRIQPFNFSELMTYSADFLAGWNALSYDISLQTAWEDGKKKMREKAKSACNSQIHGDHTRNFSMNADFSDESWRYMLLPVYLATYRYENKVFQVMVNGQTGQVAGQKPVAWWKVWTAIGAILSPGLFLLLIGIPLLLLGGLGLIPISIGGILFVIGLVIGGFIYKSAVDSEAS